MFAIKISFIHYNVDHDAPSTWSVAKNWKGSNFSIKKKLNKKFKNIKSTLICNWVPTLKKVSEITPWVYCLGWGCVTVHWHQQEHEGFIKLIKMLCVASVWTRTTTWCMVAWHARQNHAHMVHVCLAVTCHLHFWQNEWDLLCATAVTRDWNGYWNKSQHWKLTLELLFFLPLLPGLEPKTFQSRVWCSNHWL